MLLELNWILIGCLIVEDGLMRVSLLVAIGLLYVGKVRRRHNLHGRVYIVESENLLRDCHDPIVNAIQLLLA
jgi:hypothetical protein